MTMLKNKEWLRLWSGMFRQGVFPGTVAGVVVGLAPGVLLILVLTGGDYHISGSEVLGFIVMCIAAAAVTGAALGGLCAVIAGSVLRSLRRS